MIIGMFLLSLVSAISISPSTFQVTGLPGESVEKNITITNYEPDYVVSIVYSIYQNTSEVNLILNYTSPLIVNQSKTIPITFIFGKDIIPQSFKVELTAEINKENMTTIQVINSGGGGSTGLYRKVNQTENKTKIKELENQVVHLESKVKELLAENNNLTDENFNSDNLVPNYSKIWWLVGIFSCILGVVLIVTFYPIKNKSIQGN
jgi:hypothetical protein